MQISWAVTEKTCTRHGISLQTQPIPVSSTLRRAILPPQVPGHESTEWFSYVRCCLASAPRILCLTRLDYLAQVQKRPLPVRSFSSLVTPLLSSLHRPSVC